MDGQHYEFASGMFGKAEANVRNEPLAYAFVPSLKQWVESWRHFSGEVRSWVNQFDASGRVRAFAHWVGHAW
jgi:hypothetical protein